MYPLEKKGFMKYQLPVILQPVHYKRISGILSSVQAYTSCLAFPPPKKKKKQQQQQKKTDDLWSS